MSPLSEGALKELDARLREANARAAVSSEPGVEDFSLLARFPGSLPGEVELWWRFRRWGTGQILPGLQFVSLEGSLAEYDSMRGYAERHGSDPRTPELTADRIWHPLWLPLFTIDGGMILVTDTSA